ncbi:MAG: hypothetical protein ABSB33_13700 [Tepidisphaeraceae bacterium]
MESRQGQLPNGIEVSGYGADHQLQDATRRQRIAGRMHTPARNMLLSHLRAEHPDWDERRIQREAAGRLSHGAT